MGDNVYLEQYYNSYDEDGRLLSKHGQVEYITTMKYIHDLLAGYEKENIRILEVGAGTGRYSLALAHEGYRVDALELIAHNLEVLRSKILDTDKLCAVQGNALDLSVYEDETFDMTLVLGPMYHLPTEENKKKVLEEAVRVTKKKGFILIAYCMNEATVINYCFIKDHIGECLDNNMLTEDFHCIYTPENLFEMVRVEDIKKLTDQMPLERLGLIATDGASNYLKDVIDAMDENAFQMWLKYHLATCERQDLIGASNHSLDILKKI